jgi:hypothetical protein
MKKLKIRILFYQYCKEGEFLVLFGMFNYDFPTRTSRSHKLLKIASFGINTEFCNFSNICNSRVNHVLSPDIP